MNAPVPTPRTAYDDLATPDQLHDDCVAAGAVLHLDEHARTTAHEAPSIRFEDRDPKGVDMLAAAQLLAQALNLESD